MSAESNGDVHVNGHVNGDINGHTNGQTNGHPDSQLNGVGVPGAPPENPDHFVIDYGDENVARHFQISGEGGVQRQRTADKVEEPPAEKPNILYVMADQMAAPILNIHDKNSPVQTPNIDRLAEDGVVFDSAYCNSPLCAPARFCMVTGQLPHKVGAYDNASFLSSDHPTYAHYLRAAGYETLLAGKMHFIGPDQLHGYEYRLTPDIYPGDFGWSVNWDKPEERQEWFHNMSSVQQAGPCVRSNQLDFDEEVIYKSTQYLYDYARSDESTRRPFCLTVAMTHPHDPYTISDKFWQKYKDTEIPMPQVQFSQEEQDPHAKRIMHTIDLWDRPMEEEAIKRARRAYFGACSYVDHNLGVLMDVLKDCRLDKNTVVIFSGDHGDMLGERSLWYKMNWYEMSARVPMVVNYPKRFSPGRVSEHVSTMDLLPTLADITGTKVDPSLPLDGRSFYPALIGKGKELKSEVFGEYMGEGTCTPVVMIRRGQWKYISALTDPPQLFDVAADPLELTNLAKNPEYAKIFNAFEGEAKAKWDLQKIHSQVLTNQRQRRLCWTALRSGRFETWDYTPPDDGSKKYIRSTIPLDDMERRARYPPVDAKGNETWLASTHGLAGAAGQ
ncbi:MAG: hypothetical protein M1831_004382 [Alyxoria varia]|nr:MAG: hypothetical protein M1831_004382 [Alyxoria varia]